MRTAFSELGYRRNHWIVVVAGVQPRIFFLGKFVLHSLT
jgi:hypothetical protein